MHVIYVLTLSIPRKVEITIIIINNSFTLSRICWQRKNCEFKCITKKKNKKKTSIFCGELMWMSSLAAEESFIFASIKDLKKNYAIQERQRHYTCTT